MSESDTIIEVDTSPKAPTTEEVLQTTPNPDVIKSIMEEQAKAITAGQSLVSLINGAKAYMDAMTSSNPFLALAVTSQLAIFYDESLRKQVKTVEVAAPKENA